MLLIPSLGVSPGMFQDAVSLLSIHCLALHQCFSALPTFRNAGAIPLSRRANCPYLVAFAFDKIER